MEYQQGREGYFEEEEEEEEKLMTIGDTSKNPFQFPPYSSSSSSSPSSSSSQYKGVVPQPNGRWAAQIHDKSQRVWIGTFDTEEEAVKAYDQAVAKFANFNRHEVMESSGGSDAATEGGGEGGSGNCEREHMFDKVVTPSDVGKLNRLVIPKQHAEKYFPLDSAANEKGLILNFEDRNGKPWRFRYSYWNSSQSYVMTKGWSRFVKDKKLDAGDIVSFQRGIGESGKDHLYIDWKHRSDARPGSSFLPPINLQQSVPWDRLFLPPTFSMSSMPRPHLNYDHRSYSGAYSFNVVNPSGSVFYLSPTACPPQFAGEGSMPSPMVIDSVPVVNPKAEGKRLRLFGVNLDCPTPEDGRDHGVMSSPSRPPLQLNLFNEDPLPTQPEELPGKGKHSLSLDLDI